MVNKLKTLLLIVLLSTITPSFVSAQNVFYTTDKINDYIHGVYNKEKEKLYEHMIHELIMCATKNNVIHYKFCREEKNCKSTIKLYASYIYQYSVEYNLDPWLLAAVALHETNFNAYLVGKKGEKSIYQLHPYSLWGKRSHFVQNKTYRNYCKTIIGHCQENSIGIAAEAIRGFIDQSGSLEKALSMYNTGSYTPVNKKYVFSVLESRKRLINKKEINKCY